jgi:hypothetical protein
MLMDRIGEDMGDRKESDCSVTVMGLCEVEHVFLRPNQLYRFVVMPGCDKCKALDVYSPNKELTEQPIKTSVGTISLRNGRLAVRLPEAEFYIGNAGDVHRANLVEGDKCQCKYDPDDQYAYVITHESIK